MIDIFTPIIKDLEDLARTHPNPKTRAKVMHLIDVMSDCDDQNLLEIMHQFYHLREQLREAHQMRKLEEVSQANDFLEKTISAPLIPPMKIEIGDYVLEQVMDNEDEVEIANMMEAHHVWKTVIGEA